MVPIPGRDAQSWSATANGGQSWTWQRRLTGRAAGVHREAGSYGVYSSTQPNPTSYSPHSHDQAATD